VRRPLYRFGVHRGDGCPDLLKEGGVLVEKCGGDLAEQVFVAAYAVEQRDAIHDRRSGLSVGSDIDAGVHHTQFIGFGLEFLYGF
jgi:hypothetical protein